METTILHRFKESILQQRQNLAEWLSGTAPEVRIMRAGPAGERAIKTHLETLDNALQRADDATLGVCEICHEYVETSRLEMDYTASVCIDHFTGEERSRLENELELSQKVQRALLPHAVPQINGLELAAFSQPAHIVGGDYFDFVRMKDGAHAIVIADVMGKGMPASMLMASLQASLRIIAPESTDPAIAIARLNYLFCHNIRLTKFVTFFLARYDEKARTLTYCNAGHNPPLISRADGSTETLQPTGAAIGLVEQSHFDQNTTSLHVGDRILFYTDGVVESFNNEHVQFGLENLTSFVKSTRDVRTNQVISSLKESLQRFTGGAPPVDDTTFIVVSVVG